MFNHEYVGNIHVHSSLSDGRGSYTEIAEKASRNGIDFICFNDHSHMNKRFSLEEEGLYGTKPFALLIGAEIGKDSHHYLAYDIKTLPDCEEASPQEVIDSVNEQGGFGFMAHPFEKGMPFMEKSVAYRWHDLSVTGFTGICIWNFSSRWKERVKSIFHGLFHLCFKVQALKGPSRETLNYWDELCQKRKVVAVGGSDAHGTVFKLWFLRATFLSYGFLLNTINIHIFLKKRFYKDFNAAKTDIYEAMKAGRLFIANDRLAPARGFKCYLLSDDGSDLLMGEEDTFRSEGNLLVELPSKGEIRVIRNGETVYRQRGMEAVYSVKEKGVYRVEVYRYVSVFGWRPWIFTNPVYLR
ncbi:MAG: CehA/McbA family metallohydrolase [Deltaproteobacteria bacterium]|nr:CehA/McbA family metallohydrolase [Deltaproteobacteria bacterium]